MLSHTPLVCMTCYVCMSEGKEREGKGRKGKGRKGMEYQYVMGAKAGSSVNSVAVLYTELTSADQYMVLSVIYN